MKSLTLLPEGQYDVMVTENHDGDTCVVAIPVLVHLRLDGIQAPEIKGPEAARAAKAKQRFAALTAGKTCQLTLHGDYKYGGERMGSISVDGVDVAATLIAEGLAVKWDGKGPRPVGMDSPVQSNKEGAD